MPRDFTHVVPFFLCSDPAPEWVAERLAHYAWLIATPDEKPTKEDHVETELLIVCARRIIFGLQLDKAAARLKQFPAYLNWWDSQQARNEGVSAY